MQRQIIDTKWFNYRHNKSCLNDFIGDQVTPIMQSECPSVWWGYTWVWADGQAGPCMGWCMGGAWHGAWRGVWVHGGDVR